MNDVYLLDTNILLRLATPADSMRPTVESALKKLKMTKKDLCICPQSLIEFRSVATRPASVNGSGMTSADATVAMARFIVAFRMLPDSQAIFTQWRVLAEMTNSLGKQNHDARMLASAVAGGCSHLLTFNVKDFHRYSALTPIQIVDPSFV